MAINRKIAGLKLNKPIETSSEEKPKRGRPRVARYQEVWGHAANYKYSLSQAWPTLCVTLLNAQNAEDVIAAFKEHAQPYAQNFVPRLASDIFELIKETGFPQRAKAQVNYLAESLAGRPTVSLRTSRDICGKMRAEESTKSPYKIIRREFYVVCECGYKGPAEFDACRRCGAQISFLPDIFSGVRSF
jgi:hypothetical protein